MKKKPPGLDQFLGLSHSLASPLRFARRERKIQNLSVSNELTFAIAIYWYSNLAAVKLPVL
jgi:hypothetical protein